MPTYADLLNQHRAAGLDNDAALRATDDQWQTWPTQLAEARGHEVVFDAVRGERWTCVTCSRAALREGGNVYGTAIAEDCVGGVLDDVDWSLLDRVAENLIRRTKRGDVEWQLWAGESTEVGIVPDGLERLAAAGLVFLPEPVGYWHQTEKGRIMLAAHNSKEIRHG